MNDEEFGKLSLAPVKKKFLEAELKKDEIIVDQQSAMIGRKFGSPRKSQTQEKVYTMRCFKCGKQGHLNTVRNNFRSGIGKARSGKIPMWYRKKPMWYRYFRCSIGISDVIS